MKSVLLEYIIYFLIIFYSQTLPIACYLLCWHNRPVLVHKITARLGLLQLMQYNNYHLQAEVSVLAT